MLSRYRIKGPEFDRYLENLGLEQKDVAAEVLGGKSAASNFSMKRSRRGFTAEEAHKLVQYLHVKGPECLASINELFEPPEGIASRPEWEREAEERSWQDARSRNGFGPFDASIAVLWCAEPESNFVDAVHEGIRHGFDYWRMTDNMVLPHVEPFRFQATAASAAECVKAVAASKAMVAVGPFLTEHAQAILESKAWEELTDRFALVGAGSTATRLLEKDRSGYFFRASSEDRAKIRHLLQWLKPPAGEMAPSVIVYSDAGGRASSYSRMMLAEFESLAAEEGIRRLRKVQFDREQEKEALAKLENQCRAATLDSARVCVVGLGWTSALIEGLKCACQKGLAVYMIDPRLDKIREAGAAVDGLRAVADQYTTAWTPGNGESRRWLSNVSSDSPGVKAGRFHEISTGFDAAIIILHRIRQGVNFLRGLPVAKQRERVQQSLHFMNPISETISGNGVFNHRRALETPILRLQALGGKLYSCSSEVE